MSWGNLTEEKVALYLRDILEALHYLHSWRIAHLDLKVTTDYYLTAHGALSSCGSCSLWNIVGLKELYSKQLGNLLKWLSVEISDEKTSLH